MMIIIIIIILYIHYYYIYITIFIVVMIITILYIIIIIIILIVIIVIVIIIYILGISEIVCPIHVFFGNDFWKGHVLLPPRQQMQIKIEETVTELRKELKAFKGVKDSPDALCSTRSLRDHRRC